MNSTSVLHNIVLFLLIVVLASCTAQQLQTAQSTLGGYLGDEPAALTSDDVAAGLKEALINGVTKGANQASETDGYLKNPALKIPFPPEVQKVENKLRDIGMNKLVDDFIKALNRGAEQAAAEAKPIFISSVRQMTIEDAWNILRGEDKEAATNYLRRTTSQQLYNSFNPIIGSALERTNATKYYGDIINTYNKIPFVDKVNPDLDDYATQKAMDGLFVLVAKEERAIRQDPVNRTTDLLRRVFKAQD